MDATTHKHCSFLSSALFVLNSVAKVLAWTLAFLTPSCTFPVQQNDTFLENAMEVLLKKNEQKKNGKPLKKGGVFCKFCRYFSRCRKRFSVVPIRLFVFL